MQIQKEWVRNRILFSAKEEFLKHGYNNVSIRQIAKKAQITPGNIYSYFSGKEELFAQVISPVLSYIEKLFDFDNSSKHPAVKHDISFITDSISQMFLSYKEEFMILLTCSAGSRFEGMRKKLTSVTAEKFKTEFIPLLNNPQADDHLCDILSLSLIEGLISIFNIYHQDDEKLKLLLRQYIDIFFSAAKNKGYA